MPLTIANSIGVNSWITAGASSASPAANARILSFSLPAGNSTPCSYYLSIQTGIAGVFDGKTSNIIVVLGGTGGDPVTDGVAIGLLTSFPATAANPPQPVRITVRPPGQLVVLCVGNLAGGAGAIYTAGVTATKLLSTGGWAL